ncbi:hypothetical protein DFJ73DRAFT_854496 [Zopfochytrium polystomum]|nr:hypothetical protein DFJ73DRAFT_854496 [Zopfochytrium polystomum]
MAKRRKERNSDVPSPLQRTPPLASLLPNLPGTHRSVQQLPLGVERSMPCVLVFSTYKQPQRDGQLDESRHGPFRLGRWWCNQFRKSIGTEFHQAICVWPWVRLLPTTAVSSHGVPRYPFLLHPQGKFPNRPKHTLKSVSFLRSVNSLRFIGVGFQRAAAAATLLVLEELFRQAPSSKIGGHPADPALRRLAGVQHHAHTSISSIAFNACTHARETLLLTYSAGKSFASQQAHTLTGLVLAASRRQLQTPAHLTHLLTPLVTTVVALSNPACHFNTNRSFARHAADVGGALQNEQG